MSGASSSPARADENDSIQDGEAVIDYLSDSCCRRLLETAVEPRSARELSSECEIPESTVYQKLEEFEESGLVERKYEIKPGSGYVAKYTADFRRVSVHLERETSTNRF